MKGKTPQEIEKLKKEKEKKIRTWTEDKIVISKDWIEDERGQIGRNIIRGGVYMCALGENIGSEQGELRPVIVISNDLINTSSGNVYVVPLTKNLKRKVKKDTERQVVRDKDGRIEYLDEPKLQSHYFLKTDKYDFLEYDSAAMAEVSRAVSKIRIKTHLGDLLPGDLKRISTRLEWVLGIKTSSRKK
ncbi:type II toxin-antitoxin system PemK/MazF family toxin [Paenisporosarcina sp. OV554]|uniref:type II toxin-antitoxin system PemK/MazF family toxin n=1 Tax=Paenisporosarcina sp. OV554 TaxID=2135694 RepID=UPI000D450441|nr:type II toxin-antitoxin system PemK/MazF family toxin [Paenisporosarcina sp. OV554]PUB08192.1 mRNA interferase MazF [Paenisporosarcina sp. OV554]